MTTSTTTPFVLPGGGSLGIFCLVVKTKSTEEPQRGTGIPRMPMPAAFSLEGLPHLVILATIPTRALPPILLLLLLRRRL
eukprot:4505647-Pyramimonas_sp.AAC.1